MTANQNHTPLPTGNDITLPWHLRLPKPLEKDFRLYFRASAAKSTPWALALVAFLIVSAMFIESRISVDVLSFSWRSRLFTLMLTGGCLVLLRKPQWRNWLHEATLVLAFAISLTGNYLGVTIEPSLSYPFFLHTPLAILMICILIRVPFYVALGSSAIMIACMIFSLQLNPGRYPFEPTTLVLVSLAFTCTGLFGQYVYERLLRQYFLSEHVLFQHRNELHSANLVLENQATVDGMTGCINRRGMESRLNHLYHQLKQKTPDAPERITLILFDIDFFKQYNDTYGHPAGDECLKKVASVPLGMVQSDTDFVARYGGEEFVITLADSSFNDALVFAERMRNRVEQLGIPHSGSRISQVVTISVGVACSDSNAENGGQLLKMADEALYQAKGSGRNRVALMSNQGVVEVLN
ncbi:MAG: diguanylate cyclase [Alcanivorax borkumensis]|uniref:diguanylate cyclase n=1 Tax=Alcanivorax borkumensis (strain ATCC 700651 / DSM 11573 / NCIMB 13689 / SK2) TaxID=393595 RepID=Q0VMN2_ALCBS|nr:MULTISPECIES: diguanylate cyclase [Alcanivorax]OJH08230.1 MAG: diguanylate cyclase [Alcanivorax borkumensis]BAP15018.1 diguanylate cyclase [Alcanivorax sp. NBRC 101098]CAL17566.1 GGDEF domain protein [Alcanivorax borkumensis SK2]